MHRSIVDRDIDLYSMEYQPKLSRVSIEYRPILGQVSTDISVNVLTNISVDVSTNISTDILVKAPHKIHDPSGLQSLHEAKLNELLTYGPWVSFCFFCDAHFGCQV